MQTSEAVYRVSQSELHMSDLRTWPFLLEHFASDFLVEYQ